MHGPLKLIFFYFIISFWACHSNESPVKEIMTASSIMEEHPDTALYVLQRISNPAKLSEKDYAIYCLLHTQAEDRTHIRHTSDKMISVAVNYFKDRDDNYMKSKSYYYLARVNEDMENDALAEQHYTLALLAIEKTADYKTTAITYEQLGKLYKRTERYDEAYTMQQKAYSNYLLATDKKTTFPWYLVTVTAILLAGIIVILYLYRTNRNKNREQISGQEQKINQAKQTITDQKTELTLLKKELNSIKRSLYNSSEIVQKVQQINAVKLAAKEKPSLTEQDWNSYFNILEETYGFISRLKHNYPKLTDIDIRICSLLREGISISHISSVMNMIPDTLSKRMQRIKNEKMSLNNSPNPLEVIIRSI